MDPQDFAPFNLGQILGQVAAIKGAQQDRAMRQQLFEQQQRAAQVKQAADELEAHRENILAGAKIIRQLKPTDQTGWDAARRVAQQYGLPVDEIPVTYDPNYVHDFMSIADAMEKKPATTAMEQNYQFLNEHGLGDQYLQRQVAEPPMIASNGDGTFTVIPRSQIAPASNSPPPAAVDYLRKNPALAPAFDQKYGPGSAQRVLQGGAAPSNGPLTFR